MSTHGKKYLKVKEKLTTAKITDWKSALDFVCKNTVAKFDESVDVDVVLGIDAAKGEQTVRGSVLLPHGTGRKMRVVVFAKGEYEEQAKKAGADHVGVEDAWEIGAGAADRVQDLIRSHNVTARSEEL